MLKRAAVVIASLLLMAALSAQSRIDADINTRIRQEENAHSQIMATLHVLTDVYGPRVTGSPSLKAAGEWAIKRMESWGFTNGHLEPWDFGHPGWVNERMSVHIVAPVKDHLEAEVVAWTPGSEGKVSAPAFQLLLARACPVCRWCQARGGGGRSFGGLALRRAWTPMRLNFSRNIGENFRLTR